MLRGERGSAVRIRTVKPEFWQSESNSRLRRDTRLLFVGLLNLADDEGRFRAHPGFIAGQVFPFDDDAREVTATGLAELERAGKVRRYTAGGDTYGVVTKFGEHQKVDKRYPSKLPAPPPTADCPPTPADKSAGPAEYPPQEQGTGNRGVDTEAESGEPLPAEKPSAPPPLPPAPDDKFASGEAFWAWVQHQRVALGYVTEKPPRKPLGHWWSEVMLELNGRPEPLEDALRRFGANKHWANTDPPWPFPAFMKNWRDYVRKRSAA